MLRAIMDISAPAVSLADRPRTGHSGHQGSQAPGRPVLHLVSSSRRPRQENGIMSSLSPDRCSSFVRAVRPFLRSLITWEFPRLCRGGSRSLTYPGGVIAGTPSTKLRIVSRQSTRTKFRRWTDVRAPEPTNDRRRVPQGIDQRRMLNLCDDTRQYGPHRGRRPPSGGSPIGAAQRPRCRFERLIS